MSVSRKLYAVGAATAMLKKEKNRVLEKATGTTTRYAKCNFLEKKNDYFGNLVKFFNIALQRFAHQRFFSFPI
jgi:hypothetical protein